MGVKEAFYALFNKRAKKITGGNPQNPAYWVQKFFGEGGNTAAGIWIDQNKALSATAIWRAVSLVSQTIGSLPLHLYEKEGEHTKSKAINHKLYKTLHDEPNPEQTAMEFREMLQAHALTWGRAHAEIEYTGYGDVILWPLIPDRVQIVKVKGSDKIHYQVYLPDGGTKILLPNQILTLRGLGYGLNQSYNVINLFKESIGLTLAAEEFGSRFFGNGAALGGVLSHPGKLGEEGIKQLKQSFDERHQGLEQAHRMLILEEGMQYKEIAVPPEKAQYLETRKYQINDVARIIGVPPHKLAEMSQATFSNIEHQAIEFVQDTINPWCVRWEQALARQLLSDTEKKKYFFKHNLAGLVRGDFKTRMEGYSIARQNGWLSANDIRALEDMNPIEDGDIYLTPLNMEPSGEQEKEPEKKNKLVKREQRDMDSRRIITRTFKPLIRNAAEEILKRERADVIRQAEKVFKQRNIPVFEEWLYQFYEDHKEFWDRKIRPVMTSYAEQLHADAADEIGQPKEMTDRHKGYLNAFIAAMIARHIGQSTKRIAETIQAEDPIAALEEEFDQWEATRVDAIANEETTRAAGAIVKGTYLIGGVTKLEWVANPGACEFCQSLNGMVVGIEKNFVEAGGSVSSATGNSPPLLVSHSTSHPPVHPGCECYIRASTR